jgi:thymidylate kinase
MLITFSGLDGAGKSTLIEWLRARLKAERRPVAVLHMTDNLGVYACLRAIRDRVIGPRTQSIGPSRADQSTPPGRPAAALRRARNAVVWSKPLRRWIYLPDLLIFLCYRALIEQVRGRVLVMDRYFYDTLVDVSVDGGWFWCRLLQRVTPTPTVAVFLEVTPEESFARKGEFSIEYLQRRYVAYQKLFRSVPSAVRLANADLEATQQALWRAVTERGAPCSGDPSAVRTSP